MVSVRRGFLFLWVLGMGYVILLWHSLSLPYNYSVKGYNTKIVIGFMLTEKAIASHNADLHVPIVMMVMIMMVVIMVVMMYYIPHCTCI